MEIGWDNIICMLFGHRPYRYRGHPKKKLRATCRRCDKQLEVTYDNGGEVILTRTDSPADEGYEPFDISLGI